MCIERVGGFHSRGVVSPTASALESPFLQVPIIQRLDWVVGYPCSRVGLATRGRGSCVCPELRAMVSGQTFGLVDRSSVHAGVFEKNFGEGEIDNIREFFSGKLCIWFVLIEVPET